MRTVTVRFLIVVAFLCTIVSPAFAWNCSNPLDARVPVPAGTTGSYGDGNGQLFLGTGGEGTLGQLYECEPPGTNPPTGTIITNTNSSSSSSKSSSSSSSTSTNSNLNNNVATATGGAGGSVKNSGNSSSSSSATGGTSTSTATGGNSNQHQTQSASANGNGNNSNNSTSITNIPRQVASAIAPPQYSTSSCFKGFSGAAQGGLFGASFGGGRVDKNCEIEETAKTFAANNSRLAYCMVMATNKYAKAAGVTVKTCMEEPTPAVTVEQSPAVVVPEPETPVLAPIIVNVPAPVVTVVQAPVVAPPIAPALKKKSVKRVTPPCVQANKKVVTDDDIDRMGPPTNRLDTEASPQ